MLMVYICIQSPNTTTRTFINTHDGKQWVAGGVSWLSQSQIQQLEADQRDNEYWVARSIYLHSQFQSHKNTYLHMEWKNSG